MKITALIENTAASDECIAEFGLSFLIEANGRRVLFDAGQSGKIVENARTLGVDLSAVDTAVLSHGHYDHADGFPAFLEVNGQADLYVHEGYDGDYWNANDEFIGITRELVGNARVVVVDDEIADLLIQRVIDVPVGLGRTVIVKLARIETAGDGCVDFSRGDYISAKTFGLDDRIEPLEAKGLARVQGAGSGRQIFSHGLCVQAAVAADLVLVHNIERIAVFRSQIHRVHAADGKVSGGINS